MNAPVATASNPNPSSFARRERSLLRCFSTIYRAPVDISLSLISNQGSDHINGSGNRIGIEARQKNQLTKDSRRKNLKSRPRGVNGQCILDANTPSGPVTALLSPCSSARLPSLPFSSSDESERPREHFQRQHFAKREMSSKSPSDENERLRENFQCHHFAKREMASKVAAEESVERRSLTRTPGDVLDYEPRRRAAMASARTCFVESPIDKNQTIEREYKGFRADYSIGESVRSESHMIIEPHPFEAVSLLKRHDFAFIKRSDGSHSYAILANRFMEPIKGANNAEEYMVFVVDNTGCTKVLRKRHWSKLVRLVSVEGSNEDSPSPIVHQIIDRGPPSIISFIPQMNDDACSLVSSFSGRLCVY